jgi:hypothetical protein
MTERKNHLDKDNFEFKQIELLGKVNSVKNLDRLKSGSRPDQELTGSRVFSSK